MKLLDCVNWQQASVNAIRRYDETKNAVYVLADQIRATQESAALTGSANGLDGNNKTQERWQASMERVDLLKSRLKESRAFLKQFEFAWGLLDEQERHVLEVKYRSGMSAGRAVTTLCQELGYEKTGVYERINSALEKLSVLLFGAA